MKRFISFILVVLLAGVMLLPAGAVANEAANLLSKIIVTGVSQSTTDPKETIHVTVTMKNLNNTALYGVMVGVGGLSSDTLVLTNSFGPFAANFEADPPVSTIMPGSSENKSAEDKSITSISFDLLASPTIAGGNYPLALTLSYIDYLGNIASVDRTITIRVDAPIPETTTPRVIVSSYSLDKEKVKAGDTFELAFTLQNTSSEQSLKNMLAIITSDGSAIAPVTGTSNQLYVGDLAAGESWSGKVNLAASSALLTGTYTLNITMQYQDADNRTYQSQAAVGIPVEGAVTVVEVATPQVVVSSYNLSPERVFGGDEFELSFTLTNPSAAAANNTLLSFSSESNAYTAVSGAPNQIFVGKIPAGGSYSGKIKLKANDTLKSGVYNLLVSLQYQGANLVTTGGTAGSGTAAGTGSITYNSSASISIELEQKLKLVINSIKTAEKAVLGAQTLLSISYGNPGTTDILNVVANLSGSIPDSEKRIDIGPVKAGSSAFIDQYITLQSPGLQNIDISFSFEDDKGNTYTTPTETVSITVESPASIQTNKPSAAPSSAAPADNGGQTGKTAGSFLNSIWLWIVVAGVVLAAFAVTLIVMLVKKKQKPSWK